MKSLFLTTLLMTLFGVALTCHVQAQTTAFTYQGRLSDADGPVDGLYDLRFTLFDAGTDGTSLGVLTNTAVVVSEGLFATSLNFGGDVFDGGDRWLEIGVATSGGGVFTPLDPRQPVSSAPYSIQAFRATTVEMGSINDPVFIGTTTPAPLDLFANTQRGLRLEYASNGTEESMNLIGGYGSNSIESNSHGSVISGGGGSGGRENSIGSNSQHSAIGGGIRNRIVGSILSTIAGGNNNNISSNAFGSTISGGDQNTIEAGSFTGTVGGGTFNAILPDSVQGTIGGGARNTISTNISSATVAGGTFNVAGSHRTSIGGGNRNTAGGNDSTIGGGSSNSTTAGGATVAGGRNNLADGVDSTVGGGNGNEAPGTNSTVGGGIRNKALSSHSTAAGGDSNTASGIGAFVGGGQGNETTGNYGTISGGQNNVADQTHSTVSGGQGNSATGNFSTVVGGLDNTASGNNSTAMGTGTEARGNFSTAMGFQTKAIGPTSTAMGESSVAAGAYSVAMGYRAKANHFGTFVWADFTIEDVASTADNQFTVRARGGTRFFSNGSSTIGVQLNAGANSWSTISDRNRKKNITPINGRVVLAKLAGVPISTWHYDFESEDDTLHIGPMAQDFKAAFYPGRDDKSITTHEFDGVALAAIQGLNAKVEERLREKQERIDELEHRQTELLRRLEALEELLK